VTDETHAPFRPRLARWTSLVVGGLVLIGTAAIVWVTGPFVGVPDQVGFGVLGLGVAWFCWRESRVALQVDPQGLTVRNLVLTRRLEWAEVISVRFGQGRPWVQLDLSDGDTIAVMGIQRADGAFADAEARRLATLLARRSATGSNVPETDS
jgi:hypothetical protein